MILEIDNVELYFSDKRILNGIYLKAETGKVTGLLGRNGCGKSCLLSIIFGSLNPKYKLIQIDKKPILKPLYKTELVSYLPQFNFVPNSIKLKTVFKLLEVHWDDFITIFDSFLDYKNHSIRKLSGGERRIVETYLALKRSSKIVLLDEPFSHLSPLHIQEIKNIINEEKKHKAIIISDHMYQHIIDSSDAIYLLKNGCTQLINDLEELETYSYLSEGKLTNS